MNDRELLELAAKAAGYQPQGMEDGKLYLYGIQYGWNPLEDDGDALRLAVVLNLDILRSMYSFRNERVYVGRGGEAKIMESANENHDAFEAARRAIVRAAAEIGRAMP